MTHVDLAIIGTGSGNSLVTPDFDDAQVAIIEKGTFGGTCLNVGCIPTKMFVHSAEVADSARDSARFGVDARVAAVRWADIRDRIFGRIDPIAEAGKRYRIDGPNTRALLGHARFIGDRHLEVQLNDGGTEQITADQVVVATGARPVIPEEIERSGVPYVTSDEVMRIDELPRSLAIYGAGVVACEFAHIFSGLGVRVSIIARGPRLLRAYDEEVSEAFTRIARHKWEVYTERTVSTAERAGEGVRLTLDDGTRVEAEMLLVATGRRPNSDDIGARAGGIEVLSDGFVKVDEFGRTTAPGVWALGDVSSPYLLKHVANAEARAVAHNLVHPGELRRLPRKAVPSAIFSDPQIATVGETEAELQARGAEYVSKVQSYGDTAYGWALEDTTGICKVLADPSTRCLLGVHIMGLQASTLIQPAITAMALDIPADELARDQYWIHPALSEVLENALLGLDFD